MKLKFEINLNTILLIIIILFLLFFVYEYTRPDGIRDILDAVYNGSNIFM
ncbi:MAG: hypothetical protein NT120_02780 [Candidatus Aenigmarchaeota archaeon]|nr:hypothetical protein [Candidatus Aenigmarchaeota archaeon]